GAELAAHDSKALPRLTMEPVEDTMLLAYLIEPGRASYELDDLAAEYGVEPIPTPAADDETAALVRHAGHPGRPAGAPAGGPPTPSPLPSYATRRSRAASRRRCSSGCASAGQRTCTATSSC